MLTVNTICKQLNEEFISPIGHVSIDECNDLERVMEDYGHLWDEMDEKHKSRYEDASDYFQQLIDSSDGYFFGHDESYLYHMPREDRNTINSEYENAVTFECVGGGTRTFRKIVFKKIFDHALYVQAIEHELAIEKGQSEVKVKASSERVSFPDIDSRGLRLIKCEITDDERFRARMKYWSMGGKK